MKAIFIEVLFIATLFSYSFWEVTLSVIFKGPEVFYTSNPRNMFESLGEFHLKKKKLFKLQLPGHRLRTIPESDIETDQKMDKNGW